MPTPHNQTLQNLNQILTLYHQLQERIKQLETQIPALEAAGITDAHPWYKDGKYLYLVHHQTNGERTKEYIGADPDKVAAALARLDRYKQVQELKASLARLQSSQANAEASVRHAAEVLRDPDKNHYRW